jgi:pimeloyl-ACP methyl ester carboxylesterase
MATFALIHGAWGSGWHWGPLVGELERTGHAVVAPDMPCEDPEAGFDDYAEVVLEALKDVDGDVVVVGYSLSGNVAPLVAARRPVAELVYLAAMIPEPGVSFQSQAERGDAMLRPEYRAGLEADADSTWWVDFDVYRDVVHHDCDEHVVRERFARSRRQCNRKYREPCSLIARPAVPTRYILCTEDRIMNNEFWSGAVRERLGIEPVELAGSHSPMVSRPAELALLLSAPGA